MDRQGEELPSPSSVVRSAAFPAALWWRRSWLWAAGFVAAFLFAVGAWTLIGGAAGAAVMGAGGLLAAFTLFGLGMAVGTARTADPAAALLREAVETMDAPRLVSGPGGATVYANPAFRRRFPGGLDALAAVLAGGDDVREEFARLRLNAAEGLSDHAELPVRGNAGEEWLRLTVLPLPHHPGHALWRIEDVTARRQIDLVRQREQEFIADLFDQMPVGFFSADGEGRLLYVNQTLAEWLGETAEGLVAASRHFADFVVPDEEATRGDDAHGAVALNGAAGRPFPVFLLQSHRDGPEGDVAYTRSVVVRDLSRLQERLDGPLYQRLRWLFADAPVGIALVDLGGVVVDCNRAFLKLLGLHRDAVVGRPLAERIAKEDRAEMGAQLSKVLMGTMPAVHFEARMPGVRPREVTASVYASRVEDAVGETSGLILHFIDSTEQKNLEQQFTQSQKLQAIGQLAGGIAHDFNNLLTAMIGFCDLLLTRHGPGDPSFADIMQVKQNANRATNLVRQLLAFSRRQTLQPRVLDVAEALADLSHLLRRLLGEKVALQLESDGSGGLVRVDPGQFDQVVINLAVNARDAMPGGGTLTIRTEAAALAESLRRGDELVPAGAYMVIEVADTGFGIAKENLSRIFDPFFTTKEVGAGTGLGLSTVYGIVRQTDGFIFVDSAPGDGTTFTIYLPRVDGAAPAEAEGGPAARLTEAEAPADLTGHGTVLLVEDEDAVRLFAVRALAGKGYRVLEARNGEDALDVVKAAAGPIDLIVSDVVMPGMDGHTLVRFVRQDLPEVKVILVSGYAEDAIPEEIGRDPTIHFLAKPFSLRDLALKVKEVLAG